MKSNGIEVSEFKGIGYQPMIDFNNWRVALLRYIEELELENLSNMQKHDETDEVFVLLEGECTLFYTTEKDLLEIKAVKMEQGKLYNVKQEIWHTHTLQQGTTVLIVENKDTCDANSPKIELSLEQRKQLKECYVEEHR